MPPDDARMRPAPQPSAFASNFVEVSLRVNTRTSVLLGRLIRDPRLRALKPLVGPPTTASNRSLGPLLPGPLRTNSFVAMHGLKLGTEVIERRLKFPPLRISKRSIGHNFEGSIDSGSKLTCPVQRGSRWWASGQQAVATS